MIEMQRVLACWIVADLLNDAIYFVNINVKKIVKTLTIFYFILNKLT